MLHQIREPLLADKLSITGEIVDLVSPKDLKKLRDELDALGCIGIALLGQQYPEQRKGGTLMDHRQDQKINRHASEHPSGAVDR